MKEGKASRTADIAIMYRAAERLKRPEDRVCYDPFAGRFLTGAYRFLSANDLVAKIGLRYAEWISPGSRGWTVARHRFIDECLKQCVADGLDQLVILGAGYDARAYRMEELRRNIRVFEVDHPDTQQAKKAKLTKLLGSIPDSVVYVPVDFERDRMDVRLFESGYDSNKRTLFIWEAVTMYLVPEAVDETLAFVAHNSGNGSSIVMDYIFKSVVDGTCDLYGAAGFSKQVKRRGDPLRFGIEEGTVEKFFNDRGFAILKNATSDFVKSAYFRGESQGLRVAPFLGYVHAAVT
ncbi:MAG TPA: SAM-dependent methyltransferase [Dehalococcoidia bacterium]|nr:SAM-dependent methyltransferase [Dehalococcoidia bacterium]